MEQAQVFMNSLVPRPLAHKARVAAAMLGVSRSEFVRRAVAEKLERLEMNKQAIILFL